MLRRAGLAALVLLALLLAILTANALRLRAEPLADAPAPAPPIDQGSVERLAQAIRIATVSTDAAPPSAEALAAFRRLLASSFPRVYSTLRREELAGGSLLFTWAGSDPAAPALLLAAHQDVVPAEPGGWRQPPFSGAVSGGFVRGRGAIDDKASLMAILEATERLLARGVRPRRTLYLAFGHDEERGGTGAAAMAALLAQRGARIGLALDEGYAVLDGVVEGIRPPVAMIGIAEKGYVSVELTASGPGGHSAMPGPDNPALRIGRAVARLAGSPLPARLDGPTGRMLDAIAPYADPAMKAALANRWLTAPLLRRRLLASPESAAAIRTTTAVTIVQAGSKDNVLPQSARAVVNHRLLPGDTIAQVIERDRRVIDDPGVRLRLLPGAREASRPAATGSGEYRELAAAIRSSFPQAAVAPGLVLGATDGRHYEPFAAVVLRIVPITMRKPDLARFHGSDERIAIGNYMRMIAFYERLIGNGG